MCGSTFPFAFKAFAILFVVSGVVFSILLENRGGMASWIFRLFDSAPTSGRINGNGIIFDGEIEGGNFFELENDGNVRIFDYGTDTISEMKRYASVKTQLYHAEFPKDVEDLKVDGMSDFACSVCVNNTTYEDMVSIVLGRLKTSVPSDVYDSLNDIVLVKNVTHEGSFQNCTKPLQDSGKASNFLGWWTIRYEKSSDRYSACVVVSGVDITMADEIIDYKTKKETIHVADEPCHCGFFRCEICPVFKIIETRSPVFKKHSITLRQHDDLKAYMMYKSVDLIKSLTYEPNISISDSRSDKNVASSPS